MERRHALSKLALVLLVSACGGEAVRAPASATPSAPPPALGAAIANAAAEGSDGDVVIPVAPDDAARGPREAFATVVVFSDFECPGCRALSRRLDKILEAYKADDVRFVFKNFPLRQHEHARMAAEIGQGVFATKGAAAFFRYHDLVFGRPSPAMDRDTLLGWAKDAGADPKQIEKGLDAHTWSTKIDRDLALGRKLDIAGTPTIYVNGIDVEDENELVRALDEQIAKGKALVAKGVAPSRVYAQLTGENYKAPKPDRGDDDDAPPKIDPTVWKVPVGTSPVRGNPSALVTIVEFSDYACPFCKGVEPTIERLRSEYGDKLRVVWKDSPLPVHERARPAALLARAARAQKGDAAFWDVHDRLYSSAPNLTDADLERIAEGAKLDVAKAMAFVKANAPNKDLEKDDDLIEEVNATGTPHFFVNGRRIVGAQAYETFKSVVDEELAKAEQRVKAGTPATVVYDATIKEGKLAPEPEKKTVPLPEKAPFRGAANGKIVIQEFSDFQCPFCKKVEPTLDAVLAAYPGKVKIVWRDLPLGMHPDAELAAEAAREAYAQKGNDGFQKMRVKLFENQSIVNGLKRDALEQYGKEIGLDAKKLAKALDEHTHRAEIEADKKAAEDAGMHGTPGFVVGEYVLSGAKPMRTFRRWIERSLAEKGAKK